MSLIRDRGTLRLFDGLPDDGNMVYDNAEFMRGVQVSLTTRSRRASTPDPTDCSVERDWQYDRGAI
jgi:hypothetical protein